MATDDNPKNAAHPHRPRQHAGEGGRHGVGSDLLIPPDPATLVEVYHTDSDIVAGLVVDEILRPAGIYATRHDRRSHSIFAPASMPGEIGIAVASNQAAMARKCLAVARKDGVLLDEGEIVEEDIV